MFTIQIDDQLGQQLQRIAQQENSSVQQIAENLIMHYVRTKEEPEQSTAPGSRDLLRLISEASDSLDLRSGRTDISENSREIMRSTIARRLKQHIHNTDET